MSKQETAVEWLKEQLSYDNGYGELMASHTETTPLSGYFEKAAQLERDQMIHFAFEVLEGDNIHTLKSRKELLEYIKNYYKQTREHEKETIGFFNPLASGLKSNEV